MKLPVAEKDFCQFLVKAKCATYASGNDEFSAAPLLQHSHQLEYAAGDLFYRDIYYGGLHFPGMEIVFYAGQPVWAMTYYGGMTHSTRSEQLGNMGDVLKAALRAIPLEAPFRGPEIFKLEEFVYTNEIHGDLFQFSGQEFIFRDEYKIYHLEYSGGVVE